ncbi:MAG: Eco57I restriction-modification methylase domain-containing protein [Candidatus Heimdallarchaeota archaeon]
MPQKETKNKSLGQYFTPRYVAEFMTNLISRLSPRSIIEPAAGTGIFLQLISKRFTEAEITGIEIDSTLPNKSDCPIIYQDFFDYPLIHKFSIVIGNPPYVRWKHQSRDKRKRLLERSFWGKRMNGLTDLLQPFIFKSVDHLEENGELIFITPKFWQQTIHSSPLREYLLSQGQLELVVDFNEKTVFPRASLNLIIFKFVKNAENKFIKHVQFKKKGRLTPMELDRVNRLLLQLNTISLEETLEDEEMKACWVAAPDDPIKWTFYPLDIKRLVAQINESCTYSPLVQCKQGERSIKFPLTQLYTKDDIIRFSLNENDLMDTQFNNRTYLSQRAIKRLDSFVSNSTSSVLEYLPKRPVRLGDIAEIGNGMVSGLDKAFLRDRNTHLLPQEKNYIIKVIKARSLNRFLVGRPTDYIFIEPHSFSDELELQRHLPNIFQMLIPFKAQLENRWTPYPLPWWTWAFPRNKNLIEGNLKKIFVPCKERIDKRGFIRFAYDDRGYYAAQDTTVIIKHEWVKESDEYILAYLSSSRIFQYLENEGLRRGGVLEFSEKPLSEIPIRLINWEKPAEVKVHDKITNLVTKIRMTPSSSAMNEENTEIDELFDQLFDQR